MKRFHLFDPFLLTININYFCDGYKNIISIKRTGGSFLVCFIEPIKPCKNKLENETFKGSTVHSYIQIS